jgi:hypothetical protein
MKVISFLFSLLIANYQCVGQHYGISNPTYIKINTGNITSATTETTRASVGYEVSKGAGLSSAIPIKIGLESGKVGQEQSIRSQPVLTQQSVKEEPTISGIPSYHALIIAVENYPASSGLVPLNQPVKDGSKLYLTLTGKYNFPKEQTTLLKNPTRTEILQALEDISKKITPKENIIIFYAGHGVWDERLKVGYWLPSDAAINNKANWIANSTLRDYIAGIQAKHTLLITDACFSGSIFKTRDAGTTDYAMAKIYQLPSRKAMTSGTLSTVPDESKFMEYLLKRLNENNEKFLTAKQLFFSLETAVLNNTQTVPQYGTIQDTGDEGGDFVFVKQD